VTTGEETVVDGAAEASPASTVPWRHLHIRVVYVNAAVFLFSFVTGLTEVLLFPNGELWPVLVAAAVGMLTTGIDLVRWLTTRYRITPDSVELRTGWLRREFRRVSRDRIRSVDTSAKLRHRVVRLRIVHISAGETRMRATFSLDALTTEAAADIRRELVPEHQEDTERETVVSRVRWWWVFYHVFQLWAPLAAGFVLWAVYWGLDNLGVDLFAVLRKLDDDAHFGTLWTVLVVVAVVFLLGFLALGAEFVGKYWNFELVRTMDEGGALLTRHGLFTTTSTYRDDSRVRGIHVAEPLALRWMRMAETTVVTTGVHPLNKESAHILPRCPVGEVRNAARYVLPGEVRPLEVPLRRHPLAALRRRLFRATYEPLILSGILAWLSWTGVGPQWMFWIPIYALPLAYGLAVLDYCTIGHTLVEPYLVVRSGAMTRATTALQTRAVAGWTMHQTFFQRWGNLATVEVLTAAGHRHYKVPDTSVEQALRLMKTATPDFLQDFIHEAAQEHQQAHPDQRNGGES
jgi:putative membrane protein